MDGYRAAKAWLDEAEQERSGDPIASAVIEALNGVLSLHTPDPGLATHTANRWCAGDHNDEHGPRWPCPTVTAITDILSKEH